MKTTKKTHRSLGQKSSLNPKLHTSSPTKPVALGNQLNHHDPHFLNQMLPYLDYLEKYFRYETLGIENVPTKGPSLIVMNHGIIPYHGFLFTKALIEKRGIYPRGLGAEFLFSIPYIRDIFLKGGAVNANPRNAHALLEQKQCVILAPGGIYEGLVCHPGMTRIPWERRTGFVKLAIETKTPIIPTYCDGINEVYYNSKFLLKLRIKLLESTRFSLPLFFGIGILPFPHKLIQFVGEPISVVRKRGESEKDQIYRVHHEVIDAMKGLVD